MASTFQDLIDRARLTLNDADKTRYADAEMFGYALDGLREVAAHRPELFVVHTTVVCVAGVEQQVAPPAWFLIDVVANANGEAVTKADPEMLRLFDRNWRNATAGPTKNWLPFPSDPGKKPPEKFYVYPKAVVNDTLTAIVATCDFEGQELEGDFPLQPTYETGIQAYMIYRAESKDDQSVVDARAKMFYETFKLNLGITGAAEKVAKP
jgi:hypothetical protein